MLLVVGVINSFQLSKSRSEINKLTEVIEHYQEIMTKYHFDELQGIENNLECILDLGCDS